MRRLRPDWQTMTYRHSPTVDLCYFKHPNGESCGLTVCWKIKTDRGNTFKVCDIHLAWSLRFAGLPARIEEFVAPKPTIEPYEDDEPTLKITKP